MPGLRLINAASFDADTTRAMGLAYEEACASLDSTDAATREAVAKRIIEAARRGERDIARLSGKSGLESCLDETRREFRPVYSPHLAEGFCHRIRRPGNRRCGSAAPAWP